MSISSSFFVCAVLAVAINKDRITAARKTQPVDFLLLQIMFENTEIYSANLLEFC